MSQDTCSWPPPPVDDPPPAPSGFFRSAGSIFGLNPPSFASLGSILPETDFSNFAPPLPLDDPPESPLWLDDILPVAPDISEQRRIEDLRNAYLSRRLFNLAKANRVGRVQYTLQSLPQLPLPVPPPPSTSRTFPTALDAGNVLLNQTLKEISKIDKKLEAPPVVKASRASVVTSPQTGSSHEHKPVSPKFSFFSRQKLAPRDLQEKVGV
ncbi:hypothetical protein M427DRAFT_32521 [Gonapodya prolifera JEL478]|uniref:Uncharacterized protein n=1 Tax=Gonapodya prolifera (strain JEL478) TaxID=1344416 RepID=A0A139AER3_GONPJ|nr:hypothetical protein M427DRAFT_32521 [Gonapodya prolifera JEL478]|eukprot:KXS15316.1 hypothetical protein M427DRAFT_32521 [Gonapodya prolifera JEL478]